MSNQELIKQNSQNAAVVYLASLSSKNSRVNMERHLTVIAQLLSNDERDNAFTMDWSVLRYQHTTAIRSALREHYSSATVNAILSALRGVLKESWRLGQMSAEDYHHAIDISNVKGESLLTGRHIAYGEIHAVAEACFRDKSDAGARDSAIIGLLAVCGLRRSELVQLKLQDVDLETGEVKVQQGKGNKARIVWLRGGALSAMEDWFAIRNSDLATEAVFVAINKSGKQQNRPMSSQAIYKIVKKRGLEANVKNFSPHDFRRTMITDMLEKGADVLTVQKIAGHANADTTRRYDRRGEKQKQEAASKLHYPHYSRKP